MSLIFYYSPMSTSSLTEAVLAELGVPCERIRLSIQAGDMRKPEFLRINPNGRVPVIVHQGVPIWESAAITMYLGEMYGVDAKLYPRPGPERGEAMKWITWSNVSLAEAGGRLSASLPPETMGAVVENSIDWIAPEDRSEKEGERARKDLARLLKVLDKGLEEKEFLLGLYSLADTHVSGIVGWIGMMDIPIHSYLNIASWMKRCGERPAMVRLLGGS